MTTRHTTSVSKNSSRHHVLFFRLQIQSYSLFSMTYQLHPIPFTLEKKLWLKSQVSCFRLRTPYNAIKIILPKVLADASQTLHRFVNPTVPLLRNRPHPRVRQKYITKATFYWRTLEEYDANMERSELLINGIFFPVSHSSILTERNAIWEVDIASLWLFSIRILHSAPLLSVSISYALATYYEHLSTYPLCSRLSTY